MIAAGDSLVKFMYDLIESNQDALEFLGEGQELVFSLGANEIKAKMGPGNQLIFTNLEHIASLDVEDFVTLSLYNNNDPSNVLWEYAFGSLTVYPEAISEVSADDQFTYVTALANHGDGANIGWELIENSGNGYISMSQTKTENQVAVSKLNFSTKAGDTYRVRGYLRSVPTKDGFVAIDGFRDSGIIKVVAGKPAEIQITKNKESYQSDNTDKAIFTARIYDKYGNPVVDGTAVTWFTKDSTSAFIRTENVTLNGQVTAELKAPKLPIDQIVNVRAGNVVQSTTIKVNRVTGTLQSDNTSINIDNNEVAKLTVTTNAADGTPVYWTTSSGILESENVVINGSASANLSKGYAGEIAVTATIGDRILLWEGNFVNNSAIKVKVDHPYIVAGAKEDGIGEVTWADGTVRKIPYFASTNVEVTGPANTLVGVDVVDKKPSEVFSFEYINDGKILGNLKGHEINVTGGILDTTIKQSGLGSLLFDGSGKGDIQYHEDFNFKNEFLISLWLKPIEIKKSNLVGKGTDWQLILLDDGTVQATIKTNTASFKILSDNKLEKEKWSYISFDYGNDGLRLSVNGEAKSNTKANGLLKNYNETIVIAHAFNGHIDDLEFSDINKGGEILLDGLDNSGNIQLDDSGKANFKVLNTGALTAKKSSRIPINIRPITSQIQSKNPQKYNRTASNNTTRYIANNNEPDNGATTYVQIVERDAWFYTVDVVSSFFGADPESGPGFASNIAGGIAIVGDVGTMVKNTWRATGWSDKEPNLVEAGITGLGLLTELAVGAGEIADVPISVVKATSGTFGDTAFTRTLMVRVKESVAGDVPFSSAETAIVQQMAKGDYALGKVFNEVVLSDDLYKAAIRSGDHLGDEFLEVFKKIATDDSLGKAPAEALILVLSKSSDDVLKSIKNSSVPLSESLTAIAKSSGKVSPELMTKILGNDNLYTSAYKQGDLLKDIGTVSHVKGFELLAKSLSYGNVNGLKKNPGAVGFRWELDSAAQLSRKNIEVDEFTKVLVDPLTKKVSTDIDFILKNGTYVQAKASKSTIGGVKGTAPLGSETKIRAWVKKAKADGAKEITYIVPKGTRISPAKEKIFEELGVTVISNYVLK